MQKKDGKIVEVLVYPDRAYVTRKKKINLSAGKTQIIFKNLPPHVLKDSLNVSINNKNTKIEGVDIKEEELENIKNEEIKNLNNLIIEYSDKIKIIDEKIAKLNKENEILNHIKTITADNFINQFYNNITPIEDLSISVNFFDSKLTSITDNLIKLTKKKDNLMVKFISYSDEMKNKKKSRYKKVINAVINLDVLKDVDIEIFLSYLVLNTGWKPVYDARVYFENNEIELSYYGEVSQLSGENWEDVQIYLSTANPSIGASIPKLQPNFLTISNYITTGYERSEFGRMDKDFDGFFSDEEAGEQASSSEEAGLNVNFKIISNDTILSDGSKKRLLIAKNRLPVKFEYHTIPKQIEKMFVKGKIENTFEYPFIAGTVKIFHENDYIGDSRTKTIVPNEVMELSLGSDNKFKVKRERINKFRSNKGLTGNNEKYEYTYKIIINNFKQTDEEISLYEPVPISQNKEIKCRLEFATDKIQPNEKGILEWKKKINAGKKIEFELQFSVEYPKNRKLTGLE